MGNGYKKLMAVAFAGVIIVLAGVIALAIFSIRGDDDAAQPTNGLSAPPENTNYGGADIINAFRVVGPLRAKVGDEISLSIAAVNKDGSIVASYTGLVTIKSDCLAVPKQSRFLPGDLGRHQYRVAVLKAGTDIIEVTDPAIQVSGKSDPITIE